MMTTAMIAIFQGLSNRSPIIPLSSSAGDVVIDGFGPGGPADGWTLDFMQRRREGDR